MADEIKVRRRKLSDYRPDPSNANAGSERGQFMIESSLEKVGVGRSLVADANDIFVAGNKTSEALASAGIEDVIEIETDGHEIIVHKRRNFDLQDDNPNNPARLYAYYDNRSSEVSLSWSADQILADMQGGVDLEGLFFDWELDTLLGKASEEFDPNAHWEGMPEFEQDEIKPFHSVMVHFKTAQDLQLFAELIHQTLTDKTKYIYYPVQHKEDLTKLAVVDES